MCIVAMNWSKITLIQKYNAIIAFKEVKTFHWNLRFQKNLDISVNDDIIYPILHCA